MQFSCGMIVYRREDAGVRFLILRQRRSRRCSFPKGHRKAGETERETAAREVFEETGLSLEPAPDFRREIAYRLPSGEIKTVTLFLSDAGDGAVRAQEKEISGWEWADIDRACALLERPEYPQMLQDALAYIDNAKIYARQCDKDTENMVS